MPDDYVKDHVIIYTRILRSAEKCVTFLNFSFTKCIFEKSKVNDKLGNYKGIGV